jgi:hypothetical protein
VIAALLKKIIIRHEIDFLIQVGHIPQCQTNRADRKNKVIGNNDLFTFSGAYRGEPS